VTHPPVDLRVGDIRSQIAAEWLQIAQRSQWRAYRKKTIALSNGAIADPTTSPPPKMGFHMAQDTRMAISPKRVIRYTSCLVLGWGFRGRRIEWRYFRFKKSKMATAAMLEKFQMAILYLRNRSSDPLHLWF